MLFWIREQEILYTFYNTNIATNEISNYISLQNSKIICLNDQTFEFKKMSFEAFEVSLLNGPVEVNKVFFNDLKFPNFFSIDYCSWTVMDN